MLSLISSLFVRRVPSRSTAPRLIDLQALRRQRRRLDGLDDRLLCDIGLTRNEAEEEARRALWDVPSHWRA